MCCTSEIGAGEMWDAKIYSGMKSAVINTLIATQEVTDSRKVNVLSYSD
jgi:hypothetical protein